MRIDFLSIFAYFLRKKKKNTFQENLEVLEMIKKKRQLVEFVKQLNKDNFRNLKFPEVGIDLSQYNFSLLSDDCKKKIEVLIKQDLKERDKRLEEIHPLNETESTESFFHGK